VSIVNGHGEGGALGFGVRDHHQGEVERVGARRLDRHAKDARGVLEEEGHALGRDVLGGHDQIALVLAVLVVHHHDHAAASNLLNRLFDG